MVYYHGGDLDELKDVQDYKKGRHVHGVGLYLAKNYDSIIKHAKGNRKKYMVIVEDGNDINDVKLNVNECIEFIENFCVRNKQRELKFSIEKHTKDDTINASIFNVIILNSDALKGSNKKNLSKFFIIHGIDYEITNVWGYGEIMILFNIKKIKHIQRIY